MYRIFVIDKFFFGEFMSDFFFDYILNLVIVYSCMLGIFFQFMFSRIWYGQSYLFIVRKIGQIFNLWVFCELFIVFSVKFVFFYQFEFFFFFDVVVYIFDSIMFVFIVFIMWNIFNVKIFYFVEVFYFYNMLYLSVIEVMFFNFVFY